MHFSTALSALTIGIVGVNAQYYDGYENVTTSTTPVQMRQAFSGPTGMLLSWNTFSQLPNPTITYGVTADNLDLTASSSVSITYATSLTYNNHVNVTGLLPGTTYYWLPQYSNATTPFTFRTQRSVSDTTPFTVGVVVDMGTFGALGLSDHVGTGAANPLATNEQTTIASLTELSNEYEFLIHAGDIAYADYWLKEEGQGYLPNTTVADGYKVYEHILNAFFDELVDLTANKAYMVNAGNHEANCDNGKATGTTGQKFTAAICSPGQTNFTGYMNHWRMPSGPSGGVGNFWYSYSYGMTHFVHIDTETDLGNGLVGPDEGSPEYGGPFGAYLDAQVDWLKADLASVNRTQTPWIVVFGHRPWYLSSSSSICVPCKTAFEALFYQYNVDLYLSGHSHVYERINPIYNGTVDSNGLQNPNATMYITNGAAGHYDGLDTFTTIQPYSAYHEDTAYAWTSLTFTDCAHMTINTYYSANNSIMDTATLYKNRTCLASAANSSSSSSSSSTTPVSTSATSVSTVLVFTTTTSTSFVTTTSTSTSVIGTTTTSVASLQSTETDVSTTQTTTTAVSTTQTTTTAVSTTQSTETDDSTTQSTETDVSTTQTVETDISTTQTTTTAVATASATTVIIITQTQTQTQTATAVSTKTITTTKSVKSTSTVVKKSSTSSTPKTSSTAKTPSTSKTSSTPKTTSTTKKTSSTTSSKKAKST